MSGLKWTIEFLTRSKPRKSAARWIVFSEDDGKQFAERRKMKSGGRAAVIPPTR